MEYSDVRDLVNYKLNKMELIDIQEQLPPANKDVLMLLSNGFMVVGYVTDEPDLVIKEDIYKSINSEDIKNYNVIGWVDNLLGDIILDDLIIGDFSEDTYNEK